jgi:hypothetical protein
VRPNAVVTAVGELQRPASDHIYMDVTPHPSPKVVAICTIGALTSVGLSVGMAVLYANFGAPPSQQEFSWLSFVIAVFWILSLFLVLGFLAGLAMYSRTMKIILEVLFYIVTLSIV